MARASDPFRRTFAGVFLLRGKRLDLLRPLLTLTLG